MLESTIIKLKPRFFFIDNDKAVKWKKNVCLASLFKLYQIILCIYVGYMAYIRFTLAAGCDGFGTRSQQWCPLTII